MRRTLLPLALLALLAAVPAAARSLTLNGQEILVRNRAGAEYVPVYRLVQALGGRFWKVGERVVAVVPGDSATPEREYVFWPDSAVVRCADRQFELPLPMLVEEEQLLIPVLGLGDVFPEFAASVPVLEVLGVASLGDTGIVRFRASTADSLTWVGETRSSLEYRLVLGTKCDSVSVEQLALVAILAANGLVQNVTVDSGPGTVLHFMFRRPTSAQAVTDGPGVAVRFWPRPQRSVRRLVLDPGHGGRDPGAVSPAGTQEKTIVLDVAQRLKEKLEVQGFDVLLTRDRDTFVSLAERSDFANQARAELFISIHANAADNREACGFECYFLSEAKTDWERTVAARENAALELERTDSTPAGDELELILTDLAQNEYLTEASELALSIQEKTVPHARVMNRGVRQANFFVLRNNYMPAVLVECGFLTNRSEDKLLCTPKHRERLAEGICAGILEFVKAYERRINGT